jgi:dihydropteroate synthase
MNILANSPAVMGILNVTPDSFYDGGKYDHVDTAVLRAVEMINEGADMIDIGGESTLDTDPVSEEEELRRVLPVVDSLRQENPDAVISVDTYKAHIAKEVLQHGAKIINDVTAGRGDAEMLSVIAQAGCPYVMMRSKDAKARTTIDEVQYDDVLQTIHDFFQERISAAKAAGVKQSQIILDPGLGHFVSSDPKYSWLILEQLETFKDFGCPILVSPSRKSFTAKNPDEPPSERLERTLEATKMALENGASIIRTHDVGETKSLM